MRILVSTCDKYNHLVPGFAWCFNKYWPGQNVTVLGYQMPYALPSNFTFHSLAPVDCMPFTYYLRDYLRELDAEYFTFIMEDHWLTKPIDNTALQVLETAVRAGVTKAFMSDQPAHNFNTRTPGYLIRPHKPSDLSGTLLPAIWRRDYMLKFMHRYEGVDPWEFEYGTDVVAEDNNVGCRHTVYTMPDKDGVYKAGREHVQNINSIDRVDLQALRQLGYTKILNGSLEYTGATIY